MQSRFRISKPARIAFVTFLCGAMAFAQGPLAAPIAAAQQYAVYFAQIVSVIALIVGAVTMAFGNHRGMALMEILFGIGLMAYAQKVVTWLFP